MSFQDRYARSINSSNLKSADNKGDLGMSYTDCDALGAMGLADRALQTPLPGKRPAVPLAAPLERLFAGDNRAARSIVEFLAESAWKQARAIRVAQFRRPEAKDMAQKCLAWHRDGVCKQCGGHGFSLIPGTKTLSERDCPACDAGRLPFEKQFPIDRRELARWVVKQMTQAASYAGPEAMKFLAGRANLDV